MDIPANIDDPGPTPRFLKNAFPKSGNTLAITDLSQLSAVVEKSVDGIELTGTNHFQLKLTLDSRGKTT